MNNGYQNACTPPNLGSPELCQREETGEAQTIVSAALMTDVAQYTIVFSRLQPSVLPTKLENIMTEF